MGETVVAGTADLLVDDWVHLLAEMTVDDSVAMMVLNTTEKMVVNLAENSAETRAALKVDTMVLALGEKWATVKVEQ